MIPAACRLSAVALLAALALGAAPRAQQIFRTSTDMVFLSVTATNNGRGVGGLGREQFLVLEDGHAQEITVFSSDPQPIALSILIDASLSMEGKLRMAADAATGFVQRLRPGDIAQVMTFNNDTQIQQPFTSDKNLLERAIHTTRASGSTSLYTAMYVAFSELDRVGRQSREEMRRQAIVLLSDGEDTTSLLRYDEVVDRAKRSDVIVFAIGLRDRSSAVRSFNEYDYVLRTLSQTTGGRVFFVNAPAQLRDVYTQIADELASQYTIGYISNSTKRDVGWRQIAVRVREPGVVARTRAGYFSSSKKAP